VLELCDTDAAVEGVIVSGVDESFGGVGGKENICDCGCCVGGLDAAAAADDDDPLLFPGLRSFSRSLLLLLFVALLPNGVDEPHAANDFAVASPDEFGNHGCNGGGKCALHRLFCPPTPPICPSKNNNTLILKPNIVYSAMPHYFSTCVFFN
jgi:hypothetical protein